MLEKEGDGFSVLLSITQEKCVTEMLADSVVLKGECGCGS